MSDIHHGNLEYLFESGVILASNPNSGRLSLYTPKAERILSQYLRCFLCISANELFDPLSSQSSEIDRMRSIISKDNDRFGPNEFRPANANLAVGLTGFVLLGQELGVETWEYEEVYVENRNKFSDQKRFDAPSCTLDIMLATSLIPARIEEIKSNIT